jgi:hypothetical protein
MIKFRAVKRTLVPDTTMTDYLINLPARYNNSKAERIAVYLTHQFSSEICTHHPHHVVEMNIESRSEEGDKILYNYTPSCCDTFHEKIKSMIGKTKQLFP